MLRAETIEPPPKLPREIDLKNSYNMLWPVQGFTCCARNSLAGGSFDGSFDGTSLVNSPNPGAWG